MNMSSSVDRAAFLRDQIMKGYSPPPINKEVLLREYLMRNTIYWADKHRLILEEFRYDYDHYMEVYMFDLDFSSHELDTLRKLNTPDEILAYSYDLTKIHFRNFCERANPWKGEDFYWTFEAMEFEFAPTTPPQLGVEIIADWLATLNTHETCALYAGILLGAVVIYKVFIIHAKHDFTGALIEFFFRR